MRENYDIVVVGAGPAGSISAYSAVKAGASVLIIDRRRELGAPVQCGEALSAGALKEMKIKPDRQWAVNPTSAVKMVSPSGIAVRVKDREVAGKVGFILNRKVFDKYLAVRAARAGADILVGTYVDGLLTEGGKIHGVKAEGTNGRLEVEAKVIIAADGVGSRVARWAGMNTAIRLGDFESGVQFQMVGVDFESPRMIEFYLGSKVSPGGYAWVFPKGEDLANVGIGVLDSRAERRAIDYLREFVSKNPGLAQGKIVEINAGGIPVGGPLKRTVKGNVILVGDSARMVNALTGGGMDSAMRAGNIAGEVAARAIKDGDVTEERLNEYDIKWREKIGKSHERYLKAKNILLSLSDKELDQLAETLNKVNFEKISLTDMLKALIKSHPKLLWKLKGLV